MTNNTSLNAIYIPVLTFAGHASLLHMDGVLHPLARDDSGLKVDGDSSAHAFPYPRCKCAKFSFEL